MRKNIILWILEIALGVLGSIAVFWGIFINEHFYTIWSTVCTRITNSSRIFIFN